MMIPDIFFRPSTCPALEAWEAAGTELSGSLSHYTNLSQRLFATALSEDMYPLILAGRIDTALNFLHSALDRQLALSRSALARARNTLMSPAYCLPDEVFREIFMNVLYPADESSLGESMDSALRRIFPSMFSLMGVCRVWWDVILKSSDFWSLLPLYTGNYLQCLRPPALGALRAKGPLHLAVVIRKDSHLINREISRSIIDIPRIRTVNISTSEIPIQQAIYEIFLQLSTCSAGPLTLKELSLHRTQDLLGQVSIPSGFERAIHDVLPVWEYFLSIIKLLSIFRVSGVELRWDQMSFSNSLVELRLQRVIMGLDSALADFLMKLASSPALRDLKIISVKSFSDAAETSHRILFPNLSSLFLEDLPFNTLKVVLSTISPGAHCLTLFPSHKCMQIVSEGNMDPEVIEIDRLMTLLEFVPVDTLLISGQVTGYGHPWSGNERWLSGAELHRLLTSMPALKTLKIHTWLFGQEEWQAMTWGENLRVPRLENLYLARAFIKDEEFIKPFVVSHAIQHMSLEGTNCASLEDYAFHDPFGGDEDIIKWLRANVPDFNLDPWGPDNEEPRRPLEFRSDIWKLW